MKTAEQLHLYPMPKEGVTAFSTTRHGGRGSGAYGTFNCTPYTGDESSIVQANQELLCKLVGVTAERLIIPYQTHSCNVMIIDESFMQLSDEARQAMLQEKDAIITSIPNVCLCVSTADCVPVLLYDSVRDIVAAVHAGWRGTVGRIVAHTLQVMREHYGTQAVDVHAIIGPCISLEAFEVGIEVYETFEQAGFDMEQIAHWHPEKEKYHIDLPAANRLQLLADGVPEEQIHDSAICTYTQHEDFFSARRLGIRSGRILNGIVIR
jgi:YfiH family protein